MNSNKLKPLEASRDAVARSVTVKPTGCGFDPHSRRWNIYLNLYFHFFALVSRLSAALSSATQHAMPPEFGRKWGTEWLNTRFPLPTLLCGIQCTHPPPRPRRPRPPAVRVVYSHSPQREGRAGGACGSSSPARQSHLISPQRARTTVSMRCERPPPPASACSTGDERDVSYR